MSFTKAFIIIFVFIGGLWIGFILGGKFSGSTPSPLHESQLREAKYANLGTAQRNPADLPKGKGAADGIKTVNAEQNALSLEAIFKLHPELRSAWIANFGRQVMDRYGDLRKRLPIDQVTNDKLVSLLIEEKWARVDAQQAAINRGIAPSSPEFSSTVQLMMKTIDDEIKSMLGVEEYKILRLTPALNRIENEIQSTYAADFAGEPLTASQISDLALIMATAPKNPPPAQGQGKYRPGPAEGYLSPSENSVLELAAKTLTNKQIAALKQRMLDKNIEDYYAHMYGGVTHRTGTQ